MSATAEHAFSRSALALALALIVVASTLGIYYVKTIQTPNEQNTNKVTLTATFADGNTADAEAVICPNQQGTAWTMR